MPLTSDHKRTYSARPSMGSPVAVYEVLVPPIPTSWDDPAPVLPIHSPYCVAVPVVHWKVTVDELSVVPLAGLVIVAGTGVMLPAGMTNSVMLCEGRVAVIALLA